MPAHPSGPRAVDADVIPYPSRARPQAQPDRIAVVARLFGMAPADPARARVLELGCGNGYTLIALACGSPGATLVGLDLSGRQVAEGRRLAAELGLGNVRLEAADIAALPPDLGTFDYVIAHGVYSWVPAPVRDALLAACRRHLAPDGVAYVSYNTLPGWYFTGGFREIAMRRLDPGLDPAERARRTRALLALLAEHASPADGYFRAAAGRIDERTRRLEDGQLLHDLIASVNDPVWFGEFVRHAAAHRLRYLGESFFYTMLPSEFAPAVQERVAATADPVEREELLDVLRNRVFRETLLVRDEVALERSIGTERIASLAVASPARLLGGPDAAADAGEVEVEVGTHARLRVSHPLARAALAELGARWPDAVPFGDLLAAALGRLGRGEPGARDRDELAGLVAAWLGANVVRLHARAPEFRSRASDRPVASPIARHEARAGTAVTNLRLERVELEPVPWAVIGSLDGTRDRAALAEALAARLAAGDLEVSGPDGRPLPDDAARRAWSDAALGPALDWLASRCLLSG